MRLLIDNALSPQVAAGLTAAGEDALHVRDIGLQHADDEVILEAARTRGRTLVSADADLGTL